MLACVLLPRKGQDHVLVHLQVHRLQELWGEPGKEDVDALSRCGGSESAAADGSQDQTVVADLGSAHQNYAGYHEWSWKVWQHVSPHSLLPWLLTAASVSPPTGYRIRSSQRRCWKRHASVYWNRPKRPNRLISRRQRRSAWSWRSLDTASWASSALQGKPRQTASINC